MTTLVRVREQFDLCEIPRAKLLEALKARIAGRCISAFLFGSYADILVYTPDEFTRLTAQTDGFGASLGSTKIQIL